METPKTVEELQVEILDLTTENETLKKKYEEEITKLQDRIKGLERANTRLMDKVTKQVIEEPKVQKEETLSFDDFAKSLSEKGK